MTQPAARLTDLHTHGSGESPIVGPCEPTVLIGGLPAARVTDLTECGSNGDPIVVGSATVLIGGLPAARIGDTTEEGGVITTGDVTVLIGTGALGAAFAAAEKSGAALVCKDTCRECGGA